MQLLVYPRTKERAKIEDMCKELVKIAACYGNIFVSAYKRFQKAVEQVVSVEKVKEAGLFFKVSSLRVWCPITLALVHVRKIHKVK